MSHRCSGITETMICDTLTEKYSSLQLRFGAGLIGRIPDHSCSRWRSDSIMPIGTVVDECHSVAADEIDTKALNEWLLACNINIP